MSQKSALLVFCYTTLYVHKNASEIGTKEGEKVDMCENEMLSTILYWIAIYHLVFSCNPSLSWCLLNPFFQVQDKRGTCTHPRVSLYLRTKSQVLCNTDTTQVRTPKEKLKLMLLCMSLWYSGLSRFCANHTFSWDTLLFSCVKEVPEGSDGFRSFKQWPSRIFPLFLCFQITRYSTASSASK